MPEEDKTTMIDVSTKYMDRNTRFWNRMAQKYARSKIADEDAYQRKLAMTQALFTDEMKVLEFGCGTGSTAIIHAPFVKHYHATDISSEMLKIARQKLEATQIKNLYFEVTTLESTVKSGDRFDAVLGHSVLHLVNDMPETVQQAYDVLEPGGLFVSSTVCMRDSFWFVWPLVPVGKLLGLFPTIQFFSRKTLEATLESVGFSIEQSWQPKKRAAVFLIARKPH